MKTFAIKLKTLKVICLIIVAGIGTVHAITRHKEYAVSSAPDSSVPMVHDPVMIKCENTYYLFCTGPGITVMSSQDLKNWEIGKPVFDKAPEWAVQIIPGFKGHIWAPDIIYYQGEYHLFYSCSAFGKNTSAIGHATTPTLNPANPAFKWTDHGMLLQSVPGRDSWNAIDPNIIIDTDGIPWMNFGSFWDGIKLVKLTKDMSAIACPADWHSICRRNYRPVRDNYTEANDNAVEAPFIMRRGAYYYLFVSFDYCCQGAKSNYKIAVGRSTKITGPYLDKENRSLSAGGGTIILQGNEHWAGVGHCAAYHFDNKDYLVAHGYSISEEGASKLVLREIHWDENDWPVIYW